LVKGVLMSRPTRVPVISFGLLIFLAAASYADARPAATAGPPLPPSDYSYARIVRLSLVEGDVKISRPEEEGWPQALVNLPVRQGYALASDRGRAEIEFESGATVRIAEDTVLEFTELALEDGNRITRLTLNRGTATFYAKLGGRDVFVVLTRHLQLSIPDDARFRVDVDPGGASVSVFKGEVQVDSPGGATRLTKGRTLLIRAAEPDRITLARNAEPDSWDRWVADRDEVLQTSRSHSSRYLDHPYSYGTADLYSYGSWRHSPQYGNVWQPYGIAAGWSPYYHGRWVYVFGVGWTWLSYEPWGWVPYHYGTWAHTAWGWVWVPGIYHHWHPGLVVWLNFGDRIGWCPRGPLDNGTAIVQNINTVTITNTTGGIATGQPNQLATGRKPPDPQDISTTPPIRHGDIAGIRQPRKPEGHSPGGDTGRDPVLGAAPGPRANSGAPGATGASGDAREPVVRPRGDLLGGRQPLKPGGRQTAAGTETSATNQGATATKEPERREPTEDVRDERSGSMGRDPVRSGATGRAPANHPDIVYDPRDQRYVNSNPSPRREDPEVSRQDGRGERNERGESTGRGFQSLEPRQRPPRENESGTVYDPATGRYVNNPAVAPRNDFDAERPGRSESGGRDLGPTRGNPNSSAGSAGSRDASSRPPDADRSSGASRPSYEGRSDSYGRPSSEGRTDFSSRPQTSGSASSGAQRNDSRPSSSSSSSGSNDRGSGSSRPSSPPPSPRYDAPRPSSPPPSSGASRPSPPPPPPAPRPSQKPGGGQ